MKTTVDIFTCTLCKTESRFPHPAPSQGVTEGWVSLLIDFSQLLCPMCVKKVVKLEAFNKKRIRPKVVCLCGSTKFAKEHLQAAMVESLNGHIPLPLGLYGHADLPAGAKEATKDGDENAEVKQMLDPNHYHKIDMADEILVVCPGGYIGSSTKREIEYAKEQGKPVRYTHPKPEEA